MAVDAVQASLDAVAAYFDGVTGLRARVGWPEQPEALDLDNGPLVTVTYVSHERTPCAPVPLDPTSATGVWRTADLSIRVQLDLWAAYRATRDVAAQLVEAALHNDMPLREGLFLDSTGHHDRSLAVEVGAGVSLDDGEGVTVGEWRRRWDAQIATDEVQDLTVILQAEIQVETTAGAVTDTTTIS